MTYADGVATFCTVPLKPTGDDWDDLAALLGPGGNADLFSHPATPPGNWEPTFAVVGVRMLCKTTGEDDRDLLELGAADVPEMLELVASARPGPFWPRTHELGTYLGIRDGGRLVAMAGERLQPPGWTEISAVCTAPDHRGRGHASRLVSALTARITARGARPFLHAATRNTGAIATYERLGFEVMEEVTFRGFRVPEENGG